MTFAHFTPAAFPPPGTPSRTIEPSAAARLAARFSARSLELPGALVKKPSRRVGISLRVALGNHGILSAAGNAPSIACAFSRSGCIIPTGFPSSGEDLDMVWQLRLKGDALAWLLAPDVPGVRYLALRDLLDMPGDSSELRAAAQVSHTQGPIATSLAHMDPAGYWAAPGPGYTPKYRSTVWAVITLAQLGATCAADERIARACSYLVDQALTPGGQFTASGAPSGTADCLQGNLCWPLVTLGCDLDRLAPAIEWMARSVTGEGVAARLREFGISQSFGFTTSLLRFLTASSSRGW
jgi:hypothetical protein